MNDDTQAMYKRWSNELQVAIDMYNVVGEALSMFTVVTMLIAQRYPGTVDEFIPAMLAIQNELTALSGDSPRARADIISALYEDSGLTLPDDLSWINKEPPSAEETAEHLRDMGVDADADDFDVI